MQAIATGKANNSQGNNGFLACLLADSALDYSGGCPSTLASSDFHIIEGITFPDSRGAKMGSRNERGAGRGGGREAAGTSIETIRGVYAGTEALILVPTQPLFASLIDSPMEKRNK